MSGTDRRSLLRALVALPILPLALSETAEPRLYLGELFSAPPWKQDFETFTTDESPLYFVGKDGNWWRVEGGKAPELIGGVVHV